MGRKTTFRVIAWAIADAMRHTEDDAAFSTFLSTAGPRVQSDPEYARLIYVPPRADLRHEINLCTSERRSAPEINLCTSERRSAPQGHGCL